MSHPGLVSGWVGDTEKNTKAAFAEVLKTDKLLLFDEADAVLVHAPSYAL